MKSIRVYPAASFKGSIQIPGDKSISHRAVMFSALSNGVSRIKGLLRGEDVLSTIRCFRDLGVEIKEEGEELIVHGVGLHGLKAPSSVLDCGNSGTTMRLMMGILAGQPFISRLTGDESLNKRPMGRVIDPLQTMGAHIEELRASATERVIKITGSPLKAIEYKMPVASAQVKSAILLAGLYAQGTTRVVEEVPSRNHSELMLLHKGAPLICKENFIEVHGKNLNALHPENIMVPGDISSAAFFLVAGCLGEGSQVQLLDVGINSTRTGIFDILESMGAELVINNERNVAGEEVADLFIESTPLKPTTIQGEIIPRLIDEIPILAVAAALAHGKSELYDAEELRVKETDRIDCLVQELSKFGVVIKERKDGFSVLGPTQFHNCECQSHGDHRIAMSLMIAATQAAKPSTIHGVESIAISYPQFFEHFRSLGATFEWL